MNTDLSNCMEVSVNALISTRTRPLARRRVGRRASELILSTMLVALGITTEIWAQDMGNTRLLKGQSVTAENVLEALTPAPEPILTRSIKIGRDGAGVGAPPRRPSASLLVTFETNSHQLGHLAKQQLDIVAAALKNNRLADYKFTVEGHADPRGWSDANLTLSQHRAESVRQYLVSQHSIEPTRLIAQGKGDREPLNRALPAAPENRRVTFITLAP